MPTKLEKLSTLLILHSMGYNAFQWCSHEVGLAGRKCTYYYQGDQEAVVIFDDVCATRVLTRSSVPRNGKRLLTAAKNEYLIAKVGVDTAENEPPKVSPKWDLG